MEYINIYELERRLEDLADKTGCKACINVWEAGEEKRIYFQMMFGKYRHPCGYVDCNSNTYHSCSKRNLKGTNLLTGQLERAKYRPIATVIFQEINDREEEYIEYLRSKFWNFENIKIALKYYRKGLKLEKLPNTLTKEQLEKVVEVIIDNQNNFI